MKVAFWSNSKKAGVTGYTSAIAVSSVLGYGMRVTLLENHPGQDGLAKCLLGCPEEIKRNEEDGGYYASHDICEEGSGCMSYMYNCGKFDSINIGILKNKLHYIRQNNIFDEEFFDFDFCYRLNPLLKNAEKTSDICFIDTTCNSLSTKEILDEADLVAVILKQDSEAIESFFQNFDSLRKKAVFILSGHQIINPTTTKILTKNYRVPASKISVMPYCGLYDNALHQGNIAQYIKANYYTPKSLQSCFFISALKITNRMLFNNLNILSGQNRTYLAEDIRTGKYAVGGGIW